MTDFSTLVVTTDRDFATEFKKYMDGEGLKGVIATSDNLDFKDGRWLHDLHGLVTKVTKPEYIRNVFVLIEEPHSEFTELPASVFQALWTVFSKQHTTITIVNNGMHHFEVNSKTKASHLVHDRVYKVLSTKHEAHVLLLEHFGLAKAKSSKSGEQTYEGLIARAKFLHALNVPFLTTAIYGS